MQFSSTFWATLQRFQMNSHAMDSLLSREDLTFEEVLNEDMVVQEIRNQNQKLIEYLDYSKLKLLIEFVTVYPEEGADKKRCQNFPFVACEILGEGSPLHDKILENEELLHDFFAFLDSENPNATLVGYFSKVLVAFLSRSAEKVILHMSSSGYLPKLAHHLSHRGIYDVCFKALIADSTLNPEVQTTQKDLLSLIVRILATGSRFQVKNSSLVIIEVLNRAADLFSKDLLELLISETTIHTLFECLQTTDSFRIAAAANILKALLQANLKLHFKPLTENYFYGEVFQENLKLLITILKRNKSPIVNTIKYEYEPLGEDRLRVLELIALLSTVPEENVVNGLVSSGIFETVIDLFFAFPWNSILHTTFDGIFTRALESRNEELISKFVLSPILLTKIMSTCVTPGDRHRLGNLGTVHKLANALKNSSNHLVFEKLGQNEDWKVFVQGYVEIRNRIDQHQLGDMSRRIRSSSSEEGIETKGEERNEGEEKGENREVSEEKEEIEGKNEENEEKEAKVEDGKLEIEVEDKEEVVINEESLKRMSPLAKRRLSGGPLSPNNHPDYNETNFWKIQILVDELDGLELE